MCRPAVRPMSLLTLFGGCAVIAVTGCTATAQPTVIAAVPAVPAETALIIPAAVAPTRSSIADLVARVGPSVVNITTLHTATSTRPFDMPLPRDRRRRPRQRTGAGTGFIIDATGYVITNAHVIQGADVVHVRLQDEREFTATVSGRDRKLDLALIKIESPEDLPSVRLGDSAVLRVGESVLAVGNPFGLGHTVTMGIVSAKARAIGASAYDDFIQTDASINPGNSGGPLFNLRGEVVGINTAIRAGADGIGFAIPIDALKEVIEQLKEKGYVERGKLGLAFQPVTSEIAAAVGLETPHGAMVSEVMPRSAARRAGIRPGDIIIGIDDETIARAEDLPRSVARHSPGSSIVVHLLRDGRKRAITAKLDRLAGDKAPTPTPVSHDATGASPLLGIELRDDRNGPRIVRFAKPVKGLRVGDVVVEVNGVQVRNLLQIRGALTKSKGRASALFKVRRGKRHRYVGVKTSD